MSDDRKAGPSGTSRPSAGTNNNPVLNSDGSKSSNVNGQRQSSSAIESSKVRPNPLGNFSSSTYNLSLYMATPLAFNNFVESGTFDPTDNFFLVAQSGGILDSEKRGVTISGDIGANQPGLDLYIEDLNLKFNLTGSMGSPTIETAIEFKIVEPIGFSFFSYLQNLSAKINQISRAEGYLNANEDSDPPPLSQIYFIGIRFYGYDKDGKVITASNFQTNNLYYNVSENTSRVSNQAVYERFYSIIIENITYQLNGRVVTYQVTAVPASTLVAQGSKFGMIKSDGSISGSNVKDILSGVSTASISLVSLLNNQQEKEKKDSRRTESLIYKIEWGKNTELIQRGLVNDVNFSPEGSPPSTAKSTKEVTPKTAAAAQSSSRTAREIKIRPGLPITTVIDGIISNSTFVSDAITSINSSDVEATNKASPSKEFYWFSIRPSVKLTKRDNLTKDWAYEITYTIDRMSVEYAKSLYVKNKKEYKQPIKRYSYFLTGKNSEVLSFTQNYNTQFYLLQATSINQSVIKEDNKVPNQYTGGAVGATVGSLPNRGSEINQHVRHIMNHSYADQALAQIEIIGDPEFMLSNIGGLASSALKVKNSAGIAMNAEPNPYEDFIWIEIDFNSGDDYTAAGTLNISKTLFYPYYNVSGSRTVPKHGLIYRVIGIEARFQSGRFTQLLDLILVADEELNIPELKKEIQQAKDIREQYPSRGESYARYERDQRILNDRRLRNQDLLRNADLALRSRQVPLPITAVVPKGAGSLAPSTPELDPQTLLPKRDQSEPQRESDPVVSRSGRGFAGQPQRASEVIPPSARLRRQP